MMSRSLPSSKKGNIRISKDPQGHCEGTVKILQRCYKGTVSAVSGHHAAQFAKERV